MAELIAPGGSGDPSICPAETLLPLAPANTRRSRDRSRTPPNQPSQLVALDPAGPSLHLGACRRTNNAVAYLIIRFLRSLPECAGLPVIVRSHSLTTIQLVQLQARASGNADLVRNGRSFKAVSTELQHIFSHAGDLWNEVADAMAKTACRQVRMAPEALACLRLEAEMRLASIVVHEPVVQQCGPACGTASVCFFWEAVQREPDPLELARQDLQRGPAAVAGSQNCRQSDHRQPGDSAPQ